MTIDADEFIRRAQAGDREAFARVIDDHYDVMYRFACKFSGNRQDAEDITQQACIKLAKSIGQFRFDAAFTSWLYRLVINCGRDWYKAQRSRQDEPSTSVCPEEVTSDGAEPSVMLHQVLALVDKMGEGFRETLALVAGEGLTHAEAAVVLTVKESTISWRLHEIRKRLNAEIQSEAKP